MTWQDVAKAYVRRIDEQWDNYTDDLESELIPRLTATYLELMRDTGFTYVPQAVVTLGAVTETTNKYTLATVLGLAAGEGIFAVKGITCDGEALLLRSKEDIDAMNAGILETPSQKAYAYWEEAGVSYLALAPYLTAANSSDYQIAYFKRPVLPTYATFTSGSPAYAEQFKELHAEKMAESFLTQKADEKWTTKRAIKLENDLIKMRNHYLPMLVSPEKRRGPYGFSHPNDPYFALTR